MLRLLRLLVYHLSTCTVTLLQRSFNAPRVRVCLCVLRPRTADDASTCRITRCVRRHRVISTFTSCTTTRKLSLVVRRGFHSRRRKPYSLFPSRSSECPSWWSLSSDVTDRVVSTEVSRVLIRMMWIMLLGAIWCGDSVVYLADYSSSSLSSAGPYMSASLSNLGPQAPKYSYSCCSSSVPRIRKNWNLIIHLLIKIIYHTDKKRVLKFVSQTSHLNFYVNLT